MRNEELGPGPGEDLLHLRALGCFRFQPSRLQGQTSRAFCAETHSMQQLNLSQPKFLILHSSFFIPHSSFLIPHSSFLIKRSVTSSCPKCRVVCSVA